MKRILVQHGDNAPIEIVAADFPRYEAYGYHEYPAKGRKVKKEAE
jgi:hypothetical protein